MVNNYNDLASKLKIAKQNELALLAKKEKYLKSNKLEFFRPIFEKQHQFFANCDKSRRAFFAGNRVGKAVDKFNTSLLTPTGWRTACDIRAGDEVFDGFGKLTTIVGVFEQGQRECFKVCFDDRTSAVVDGDHLWKCKGPEERFRKESKRYGNWLTKSTRDIINHVGLIPKRPKMRYSIPFVKDVEFETKEVFVDPYVLGVLLGDWCLTQKNEITITSADSSIVDEIKKLFHVKTRKEGIFYRINGIKNLLNDLELLGLYSWNKFIPGIYLFNCSEIRMGVIQGLMDTDGYVCEDGKHFEYCTVSENLANGILFLLRSFGVKCYLSKKKCSYKKNGIKVDCRDAYRIFGTPEPWMFRLERKRSRCKSKNFYTKEKIITSIEPVGLRDAVCFAVNSDDHTYLINDLIVTHNSTIGVVEDCSWALGERIFYPKGHELRRKAIPEHGVKGVVIAEDWDKAKEIFTDSGKNTDRPGKFFHFLPETNICGTHTNQNGVIDIIYVENMIDGRKRKSTIYIDTVKSFKNNGAAHESSDWDFIHIDEPIPEDMWKAMSRGLIDRAGKSWWLMTPLKEAWMYYYIIDSMKDEKLSRHFWMAQADMDENPTLSQEEKELYLSGLTPEEIECRKKGLPTALGTLVYPYFDAESMILREQPNGWKSRFEPPNDWNVGYAIDPHSGRPHAVLFVAWCEQAIVFYDEIFEKCLIEELCFKINERMRGRRPTLALCDPCAWNPDVVTGRVWASHFWEHGVNVCRASKDMEMGIVTVNDLIKKSRSDLGKKFYVLDHCRTFINEIRKYAYKENGKPVDKDDHMMECLRRLAIVNNFNYKSYVDLKPVHTINHLANIDFIGNQELKFFETVDF